MKRLLIFIVCLLLILSLCLFVSCGDKGSNNVDNLDQSIVDQIKLVYDSYVAYAEDNGETPLSYDKWLETIKGAVGKDGLSAYELYKKYNPTYTGTEEEWVNEFFTKDEEDGTEGLVFVGSKSLDGTYCVDRYEGVYKDVIIPSTYKGGKVVGINANAFSGLIGLTSVSMPDTLTSIENSAFWGCTSLTSLIIPDSVKSIDVAAFSECTSLTSVKLSNNLTTIDNCLFEDCTSLQEIIIPSSVTDIKYEAFDGCSNLANIVLPNSIKSIESQAFYDTGLTSIEIPDGIESISDYAFSCKNLISAKCPASAATAIGNASKSSLTSVEITSGTYIPDSAFSGCKNLSTIILPSSLKDISWDAFIGCSGLKSVTIPESVTAIGSSAFSGCSGLTSMIIPDNVTYIGCGVFFGCSGLKSLTLPFLSECLGYLFVKNSYVQDEYNSYVPSSLTSVTIKGGNISSDAFYGCSMINNIILGDDITCIGAGAFTNCDGLLYNGYKNAYYLGNSTNPYLALIKVNDTSITSFDINENTRFIDYYAFEGCTNLVYNEYDNAYYLGNSTNPYLVLMKAKDTTITTCDINENTTIINCVAFYECSELTSINIPKSVSIIGFGAFLGCIGLESIIIPECVTSIGDYAFAECAKLESITIPESVTSIGIGAFAECAKLESITIPESVTSIGIGAFASCIGLERIIIPKSVTIICRGAFSGCMGLKSIIIPKSVSFIGEGAFCDCDNLETIYFEASSMPWCMYYSNWYYGSSANVVKGYQG